MEAKKCIEIFNRAIDDYHVSDHIDAKIINPFQQESFEAILYQKCWIDTVQWLSLIHISEPTRPY